VNGLAGTREVITAAFLGSAQLSAVTDLSTQMLARKMNAMPQIGVATAYLKQLNPASAADRRTAIRLGLGMRDATRAMTGMARYVGETHGPRWSQVVADDVLRLSGLNKWTEAGQRAFGMDLLGQLAEERRLSFAELPEARRERFARYGIGEADWDLMRAADVYREGSTGFMDFEKVAAADQAVADRMMDYVLRETRAAVQEADLQAAAMMRWGRPGTLQGEIGANILQFKSFPVALIMNQARRMAEIYETRGLAAAGAYGAQFIVGMTLFGAIALQLKEIAKGRDMRPMEDEEFWSDALFQGGGLGIFGDLIGSFSNDRQSSVLSLAGGPVAGMAQDARDTLDNFFEDDEEQGDQHNPGRAAVRFAKRYTPGSSLWYARAALERLVWDEIAEQTHPGYSESWQRMEERAAEQGQDYWWRPGEDAPERMPGMGEAPPE
jgi:hypothetical protein